MGDGLRVLRRLAEGRWLRPAQRSAEAAGAGSRGSRRRAERVCAGRTERQDLRERAHGRSGTRRRTGRFRCPSCR
ncbi:hypothetical protein JIX56_00545 [Streptomyces sp. CA-210063]|nr:hypothetical protein JIX56_00545 [Streptomyces sp. CA-210063]